MGIIEKALESISKLYEDNDFTLDQIAEQSGVGRTTVYNYCSKHIKAPSLDTLERIASVYGYTVSELLTMEEVATDPETRKELSDLEQKLAEERTVTQDMEVSFKRRVRELRRENKMMSDKLNEVDVKLAMAVKEFQTANRDKRILFVCLIVAIVLLLAVSFYAGFAYMAFDVLDPTKGLYRG